MSPEKINKIVRLVRGKMIETRLFLYPEREIKFIQTIVRQAIKEVEGKKCKRP